VTWLTNATVPIGGSMVSQSPSMTRALMTPARVALAVNGRRWFDVDHLAAAQSHWQRYSTSTPAYIDDDIIRDNIRGNDLQILVEWPMRIDSEKRTIGTETREEIPRRLGTTEAAPLREDSIHARCIVAGSSANIS